MKNVVWMVIYVSRVKDVIWFLRLDKPNLQYVLYSFKRIEIGRSTYTFLRLLLQFVGVSASRTFLSPFTKGTRVLALVIRLFYFSALKKGSMRIIIA